MLHQPIIELLRELEFVAGLSPAALAELAAISHFREWAGGAIVFREGTECEELFLVVAGEVALDMHVPSRGAVRILTVGAGEMLGWSALIGNGRMTATATVVQPVSVIAIPGPALRSLCETNHDLGYQVMRTMAVALSRRLLATRLQLLDLFSHDVRPAPLSPAKQTSPRVTISSPVQEHDSP